MQYYQHEFCAISEAAKRFSAIVSELDSHKRERVVIVKNNTPSVIILPLDTYESMVSMNAKKLALEYAMSAKEDAKTVQEFADTNSDGLSNETW